MNPARWLGVDPRRVVVLAAGLERADRGAVALALQTASRDAIGPGLVEAGLFLLPFFVSILVAGVTVALGGVRPADEAVALTIVAGVFAMLLAAVYGIAILLRADDARVLGHWPVSARDVGAARLVLLLTRVLRVIVPCGGLLALPAAIHGRPPVLLGVVTWGSIVGHAVVMTLLVGMAILGLRRALGVERAQRTVLIAGGLFIGLGGGGLTALSRVDGVEVLLVDAPEVLLLLPNLWFVVWPGLLGGPRTETLVVVGGTLMVTVGLALLVVRTIARGDRGEGTVRPAGSGRGANRTLDLVLRPWLPGRRAAIARRLVIAHLVGDWHFGLRAVQAPSLVAFLLLQSAGGSDPLGDSVRATQLVAVLLGLGAGTGLLASATSRLLDASWILRTSPASHAPWAAWQRGMVRASSLVPAVAALLVLAIVERVPALLVLDDLAVLILLHEASLRWTQCAQWRAPFTLGPGFTDARLVAVGVLGVLFVLPATVAWFALVHARHPVAVPATYAFLLAAIAAAVRTERAREPLRFA